MHVLFCDRNLTPLSESLLFCPVSMCPRRGPISLHKPQVLQDEELESPGPLDHQRTLRQWELQHYHHHEFVRANMRLFLDFLIVLWGAFFMMIFISTLTKWRLCGDFLNVTSILGRTREKFFSKSFLRTLIFLARNLILICVDPSANRACAIALNSILENYHKCFCIHRKSQFGVQFVKSQWQWILNMSQDSFSQG